MHVLGAAKKALVTKKVTPAMQPYSRCACLPQLLFNVKNNIILSGATFPGGNPRK